MKRGKRSHVPREHFWTFSCSARKEKGRIDVAASQEQVSSKMNDTHLR